MKEKKDIKLGTGGHDGLSACRQHVIFSTAPEVWTPVKCRKNGVLRSSSVGGAILPSRLIDDDIIRKLVRTSLKHAFIVPESLFVWQCLMNSLSSLKPLNLLWPWNPLAHSNDWPRGLSQSEGSHHFAAATWGLQIPAYRLTYLETHC